VPAYKVLLTSAAERDVEECVGHISRDNPDAAGKWLDDLLERMAFLGKFPARAPRIPETSAVGEDYRHLVFGKYRIVFRIKGKTVLIVRVVHSARLLDLAERPE
jgi:toxin ParE1/3/4